MSKKLNSAVILLSGGLDSTVCLWWAKKQAYSRIDSLTFEYGSKEEVVLKQVAKKLGELASVDNHEFINLEFLAKFSRKIDSALSIDSVKELPKPSENELDDQSVSLTNAQTVWIPGRNLLFLSIASAYAETIGKNVDIITGFNLEEGTTFPDNTIEFIEDFTRVASRGILHAKITVVSPLVGMKKSEIVQLGEKLKVPFEFSNSCYNPKGFDKNEHPIHCGVCESCLRRKRGFRDGVFNDPTNYDKNNK